MTYLDLAKRAMKQTRPEPEPGPACLPVESGSPAPASRAAPDPGILPADLPADWHLAWDERAAIIEYDGKLPRERAEALALADVLRAMERAGEKPRK